MKNISSVMSGSTWLIEVIDEGTGFDRAIQTRELPQTGGWGLRLVDCEASRWGLHEGTTHVWFELERAGTQLGTGEDQDWATR